MKHTVIAAPYKNRYLSSSNGPKSKSHTASDSPTSHISGSSTTVLSRLEYQAKATVLPSTTDVARLRLMMIADDAVVREDRRPNIIPSAFNVEGAVGSERVADDGVVL